MNRSGLVWRGIAKRIFTLLIVAFVPVAVVVALIPSEYEAVCTIAVRDSEPAPPDLVSELSRDQFLDVKYSLLDGRNLLAVISKLDIKRDHFPDPSWRSFFDRAGINVAGTNRSDVGGTYPSETLVDCIRRRITVKPIGENKIDVGYTGRDNGFNVRLVNAIVEQFIKSSTRPVRAPVVTDLTFLESDLARYRSEIADTERKIIEFETERIADLDVQIKTARDALEQDRKEFNTVKQNIEDMSARIDSVDGRIASAEKGNVSPPDPEVEQRIKGLTQVAAQMEVQLSKLKAAMTDKHPQVVAKERELAEIRKELDAERAILDAAGTGGESKRIEINGLRELRALLVDERDRAAARLDTIKERIVEGEKRVQRLVTDRKRVTDFVRQFSLDKKSDKTYATRSETYVENQLSRPIRIYEIVKRAQSSVNPVGPNRILLLAFGTFICGALYLVAVASVRHVLRGLAGPADLALAETGGTVLYERRQTVKRAAWCAVLTLVYCLLVFMLSSMGRRPNLLETIDMVTQYNLAAHVVVYAGLGWLVGLTVRTGVIRMKTWQYWVVPIVFVAMYGLINELNQWLVLNLHSDLSDVAEWVADVVGGIVAQFAFLIAPKRRRNRTTD